MSQVSDLVNEAKLPTKLGPDSTVHTFLESTSVSGRRARRREREELWKRVRHLGLGIFGTVWLEECVSDGGNDKLRAVKEVRKFARGLKPIDYTRELAAIAKFSQQRFDGCFVKSPGWFENDESLFISLEYFPLGNLQKYMTRPIPEPETQQISLQLLEGLDFMHTNGFAHRDLKPQNVFVLSAGPDWWVKIGDFGISKRVLEGLTGLQALNGTPAFTAPEIFSQIWNPEQDNEQVSVSVFTPEADIWSLGVIAYHALTGKVPFAGQSELLAYYQGEAGPPVDHLTQSNASTEASDFLQKTLAATPPDRLTARDALDHVWLVALQQESGAEERDQTIPAAEDTSASSPSRMQRPSSSQDVVLPGTIDLTSPGAFNPSGVPEQRLPSPTYLGLDGDTYKQIVAPSINRDHPPLRPISDNASTRPSPYSESGSSAQGSRPLHTRQLSQLCGSDMSQADTLPPYTRRRSDAAPIPISDLTDRTPTSGSPTSSVRNSSDRFTEKVRRVSQDIVPKRSRRSQDQKKKKTWDTPTPQASSNLKTKSQIVEIPGRPQFAEGLPMFPMRSKKA